MTIRPQTLLLKIFSGPHVGAEMALRPGHYTVGRGAGSDIVLQDELISDAHLRLTIGEDNTVTVQALNDAQVIVGDGNTSYSAGYEISVAPYEMVTAGATHFAIGQAGGDWSSISFPQLYRYESPPPAPQAKKDDVRGKIQAIDQNLQRMFDNFKYSYVKNSAANNMDKAAPAAPEGSVKNDKKKRKNKLLRFFGFMVAIFFGVGLSLTLGVYSNNKKEVKAIPDYALIHTAESVIESLGYADVWTETVVSGEVTVGGYVESEKERAQLQKALSDAGLIATLKVQTGSALVQSAKDVLRVLGYPDISVGYEAPGKIETRGYVHDLNSWQRVKDTLNSDIYGLKGIVDSGIRDFSMRYDQLEQTIEKYRLGRKLVIKNIDDRELEVYGVLGPEEMKSWRKILTGFRKELGNAPPVISKVHDTRKVIKLDIKSVRVGDVPYIIMVDGSKFLEGGILPNGYTVKDISSDKILLSKNKVEAVYYLGN